MPKPSKSLQGPNFIIYALYSTFISFKSSNVKEYWIFSSNFKCVLRRAHLRGHKHIYKITNFTASFEQFYLSIVHFNFPRNDIFHHQ